MSKTKKKYFELDQAATFAREKYEEVNSRYMRRVFFGFEKFQLQNFPFQLLVQQQKGECEAYTICGTHAGGSLTRRPKGSIAASWPRQLGE